MSRYFTLLFVATGTSLAQVSPHGDITLSCQDCHGTDSWAMRKDATFNHKSVGFELTGRHKQLTCESCHRELRFDQKMETNCSSCHTDVHRAELGVTCQRCHTTQAWHVADMVQKHQQTRFPLLGRHAPVNCQSCHERASEHQFVGTPTNCIGCHRTDFRSAKAPDHMAAGFSTNCEQCHRVTAYEWGQGFDHNFTAFPLSGAHVAASCVSCHRDQTFKGTPSQCIACHQSDYVSATSPNHVAANFSTDCQTCHTTAGWEGGQFDHNQTQFALTGAHRSAPCADCHVNNQYQGLPSTCYECHTDDFQRVINPNHSAGNFNHDCVPCHTTTGWLPSTFSHATTTFPLTGAHQAVSCSDCHVNNQYQGLPTICYDCHTDDFNGAVNPNHVTANFNHDCVQCHTTGGWSPAYFDHNATNFLLTGAHVPLQCQSCHTNGNYQLVYQDCYQCHQADFQVPTTPNHVAGNFGHNCVPCHTTTAWLPSTFSHNNTVFPLTGAHQSVACINCHVNNQYQGLPTACYDCHVDDFNGAQNPNHVAGNFNHECMQCHTTAGWAPAFFDHNTTNFPITGAHVPLQCQSCHINGNYQLVYQNCYQCHQADFQLPINPNHVAGNFSHTCVPCHTTTAWLPSTFNHGTTQFPLTGAHQAVACQDCHINGNYQLEYQDCYQCHQADFQQATNPNHVTGNFNHDCLQCHTTNAWSPATFDHDGTNFPLTGAHVPLQCESCHINGNYNLVYVDCYQCHQSDFQVPTNPNHAAGNFSHNCVPCHTTTAWMPSTFSHSNTIFPLTGAHAAVACNSCHVNNQYQGLPTACYDCHTADFNNTTNPNHVAGNFNHDCLQCHTTSGWSPATFDHNQTNFPLTGSHVPLQCHSCHINGNYNLVYVDCYQCHQADYQVPADPNHVTLQFSHQCETCHTTNAWLPSTFNHDTQFFKIYSGRHRGKWSSCSQCHPSIGNYTEFTCISCHEHNQADMDHEHEDVTGYVYSSPACYSCHRYD